MRLFGPIHGLITIRGHAELPSRRGGGLGGFTLFVSSLRGPCSSPGGRQRRAGARPSLVSDNGRGHAERAFRGTLAVPPEFVNRLARDPGRGMAAFFSSPSPWLFMASWLATRVAHRRSAAQEHERQRSTWFFAPFCSSSAALIGSAWDPLGVGFLPVASGGPQWRPDGSGRDRICRSPYRLYDIDLLINRTRSTAAERYPRGGYVGAIRSPGRPPAVHLGFELAVAASPLVVAALFQHCGPVLRVVDRGASTAPV